MADANSPPSDTTPDEEPEPDQVNLAPQDPLRPLTRKEENK